MMQVSMTVPGVSQAQMDAVVAAMAVANAVQTSTPTTGQTVVFTADNRDRVLYVTPAGTLLNLTITLPADATSRLGQYATVVITQAITNLTINGATVLNASGSILGGQSIQFVKVAANTWSQLGAS